MRHRPSSQAATVLGASLLIALLVLLPSPAAAHAIDSATLLLKENAAGAFHVEFQSGSPALGAIETKALYPRSCQLKGSTLSCGPAGLSGTLEFPWLAGTLTHLLVNIEWLDGSRMQRVVSPDAPRLSVYDHGAQGWASTWPVLSDYGWLGIEHILGGFDHLCFVLALALLVRDRRLLVATITAFTLAHSITLGLTALGFVRVPIAPVEATIALSIVLVCVECLRTSDSWTRRAPWIVAFAFGLLHGFGFASALLEVGLPETRLPAALLGFNLGVELGQLLVVLSFLGLTAVAARLRLVRPSTKKSLVYVMGSVAAFWSIDRVLAAFGLG